MLFKMFGTTIWLVANRRFVRHWHEVFTHVAARAMFAGLVVTCGWLHGVWTAVGLLLVYSVCCSQAAFLLLYNDFEDTHNVLGTEEDVGGFHGELSWAEVQVRTSNNWYPTNWLLAFVEFHDGYFNYHIGHHLFPSFKPRLLKRISPVVREVCRRHGVPYVWTPFFQVPRSLQRHLVALSAPNDAG